MKKEYYGVYGKNAAGIFDSWDKVQQVQSSFIGFKNKKFDSIDKAIIFTANGMENSYGVIKQKDFDYNLLLTNVNIVINIEDLIKPETIPWSIKIS